MNSLVVWYEPIKNLKKSSKVEEGKVELDLHFNHWKLKKKRKWFEKKEYEYLLDVGVRVKNGKNIDKVCFFLPDKINEISSVFEDLGEKLKEPKLLTAVFNENFSATPKIKEKYFEVKLDSKPIFNIYSLDVESDIIVEDNYNGTIIKFPFKEFSIDTYYRFRLKTPFVQKFSTLYKPKNSFLESVFSSIELIDFRVNDTRDINLSLLEYIKKNGMEFHITLIHLFIMRSINDDYIISDINLKSIRKLEENTWSNYIGEGGFEYERTIAYHLKAKVSQEEKANERFIEDYNALIKFKFEDNQILKYFIYLIFFALITSVIGNLLTSLLI